MKHMLKVLVAALVIVALMVAMAIPAFAGSCCPPKGSKKVGNPDDRPQKMLNFQGGPGSKFKGPKKLHF